MKTKTIVIVLLVSVLVGGSIGWLFYYKTQVGARAKLGGSLRKLQLQQRQISQTIGLIHVKNFNKPIFIGADNFVIFC